MCVMYTVYEEAVIFMIAPNPYQLYYFLWECHVWFTPTFSATQPEHKTRTTCIYKD